MGALQSFLDASIDGFPPRAHRNSEMCCHTCGMHFDRPHEGSVTNHALWIHSHYLAELCGIWLGSSDSSQQESIISKQTDPTSQFVAFPSTTLPKRSVPSSKPSMIVSTLIKHTDFTKNERSALKHGFFSTTDMNTAGLADCSGLEGCHIKGCLYVEHDCLVFQAVDSPHQLPSVLTNRKDESFELPNYSASFGATVRPRTRGSDPVASGSDVRDFSGLTFSPYSMYKKTRRKLWAYLHDGRLSPYGQKDSYCNSLVYRKDQKSTEVSKVGDFKFSNQGAKATTQRANPDIFNQDNPRLPPPPLRLSWPLCTLRRFGFYGNTLFKLEAGRRAPRGEGHYLFRIRALREFRQYFEHFVHRRKSLSPSKSPPERCVVVSRFPGVESISINEAGPLEESTDSFMGPLSVPLCPTSPNPLSAVPANSELNLAFCPSMLMSRSGVRQKANSLTNTTSQKMKISLNCLDWIRQQQEQQQQKHFQQDQQQAQMFCSDQCFVGLQNSCPHLSSAFCADFEAHDVTSLLNPLPPPQSGAPLGASDLIDLSLEAKIYDNVQLDCLQRPSALTEHRLSDHSAEAHSSREWLSQTSVHPATRGRLYTSRRAMTVFACSNLYPIPSQHHEEEEDEATDEEEGYINGYANRLAESDAVHHSSPPIYDTRGPDSPCVPLVSSASVCYHAGSAQSGNQTPLCQHRQVCGAHLRHTSLPNPISPDALFTIPRVGGSCSQPTPVQPGHPPEIESTLFSPPLNDNRVSECGQHLAYYNLSSPEALGHLGRNGKSSRSGSFQTTLSPSNKSLATNNVVSPFPSFTTECDTLRATALHRSNCRVNDDLSVTPSLGGPQMHSCADLRSNKSFFACSCPTPTPNHDEADQAINLHYATLDFSPSTPDRVQSSIDLHTMGGTGGVVCAECTNEHCIHDTVGTTDGRDAICPMRVYGTFVHDPLGHVGSVGARARSLSSSGTPFTIRSSNIDNTNNELPANYVAICQLQTLAMRAVLNATT